MIESPPKNEASHGYIDARFACKYFLFDERGAKSAQISTCKINFQVIFPLTGEDVCVRSKSERIKNSRFGRFWVIKRKLTFGWGLASGWQGTCSHAEQARVKAKFDGEVGRKMGFQSYTRDLKDAEYAAVQNLGTENGANGALKRITDFAVAVAALIFLLPIMLPLAVFIRLSDGGPALFRQKRIGRDGREFWCFKFRSMVIDADVRLQKLLEADPVARREWQATQKLENDPRITTLGHILRKSSLDELPQLINILKGEMSIVGPRPIVQNEVEKYGDYFGHYCQVRPGLTGLWQVSGRSDTSYGERVALDVKYVSDWSYVSDIKIMAMTIPAVLLSDGAR